MDNDSWYTEEKISRMEAALRLVLLFHGAGPWDLQKRLEWDNLAGSLLAVNGRCPDDFNEATTKNLCNAVREALK